MKKTLFILLLTQVSWAACPLYQHRNDPSMNQEIQNICANIANPVSNTVTANQIVMNGGLQLKSLTLVQIQAVVGPIGQEYYCSNCSADAVCVSTSTKANTFVRLSARTTACN